MDTKRAVRKETLALQLQEARTRTRFLLRSVSDKDLTIQHDPIMGPLIWDYGHIGNYEELWLLEKEEPVRRVSRVCGGLGRRATLNLALTDGLEMAFIRHSTEGPGNSLYLLEDGDAGWREVPDRMDRRHGASVRPLET